MRGDEKNKLLADDDYDVTLESIAQELGISRQAVYNIQARAFRKLRACVELQEFCAVRTVMVNK